MNLFILEIKTPDKLIFSGEIESLMVEHPSGKEGYLANHEPVLKELASGTVRFTAASPLDAGEFTVTASTSSPSSDTSVSPSESTDNIADYSREHSDRKPLVIQQSPDSYNTYFVQIDGGFLSFLDNKATVFIR